MGGVRHQEYSFECGISAASNGARPTVSLIQLVRTTRICEFLQQTMANGDYVVRPTTLVPEPDTKIWRIAATSWHGARVSSLNVSKCISPPDNQNFRTLQLKKLTNGRNCASEDTTYVGVNQQAMPKLRSCQRNTLETEFAVIQSWNFSPDNPSFSLLQNHKYEMSKT